MSDLTRMAEETARGSVFLFAGNAASTVILAIGAITIGRLLGPSNYGLYTLTLVMPSLLVSLADLGIGTALVRYPAKFRSQGDLAGAGKIIRQATLVKLSISLVASVICYAGASTIATTLFNRVELAPLLRLAAALIVFQALFDAASISFIGLDLMHYSAGMQILYAILKSVLVPVFILIGLGLTGAISAYVLAAFAAGLSGAIILFTRHARATTKRSDSSSALLDMLLRYSLPLYFARLLTVFLTPYQNIILARFATNLEIGNFNAAMNFNMLFIALSYPITTAIFPMFSKLDAMNQKRDMNRTFELASKFSCLVIFPLSIVLMILSGDILYFTYGSRYTLAPGYLILFSASWLLAVMGSAGLGANGVLETFFIGVGDTRTILWMNVLTLAVFIPVVPALAWFLGTYGVIIGVIIDNTVPPLYGMYVAFLKYGARANLRQNARVLVVAVASGIPTLMLLQLHSGAGTVSSIVNLTIGGLLYLITYLTLAPVLGALNRSDVDNLRTMFRMPIVGTLMELILRYEMQIIRRAYRES